MTVPNFPVVNARMLIRKPVSEVFEAFVNPDITTRFWYTRSSGRMEAGAQLRWEWEMFGVGTTVMVKKVDPPVRILIEWDDPPCPVEWRFTEHGSDATLVEISAWGFRGTEAEVVTQAIDSKGGFTIVLAGAKAWLEHGVALDLVRDQFPAGAEK
jgi:uncharacterized protein YndB with AHSA1/START domain